MKVLDDGRVNCRVKIIGTFHNQKFEYIDPEGVEGSQYIWPDGDPSTCWWTDGNYSCDCNRAKFVGLDNMPCGETINLEIIKPIDFDGPTLVLNETKLTQGVLT